MKCPNNPEKKCSCGRIGVCNNIKLWEKEYIYDVIVSNANQDEDEQSHSESLK